MRRELPIHIGHVIRNAIAFDFKNWREDSMEDSSLLETVARLFQLLSEREIEYVLVGGVALLTYIAGRNTEDIDLIMAVASLDKLPEIKVQGQDANIVQGPLRNCTWMFYCPEPPFLPAFNKIMLLNKNSLSRRSKPRRWRG